MTRIAFDTEDHHWPGEASRPRAAESAQRSRAGVRGDAARPVPSSWRRSLAVAGTQRRISAACEEAPLGLRVLPSSILSAVDARSLALRINLGVRHRGLGCPVAPLFCRGCRRKQPQPELDDRGVNTLRRSNYLAKCPAIVPSCGLCDLHHLSRTLGRQQ